MGTLRGDCGKGIAVVLSNASRSERITMGIVKGGNVGLPKTNPPDAIAQKQK